MEAIYFIWGEENYLIDRQIEALIAEQQREAGETEVVYLDAEELRPAEWARELEYSPLFLLSRIVIMKRPPWLTGSKRVRDEKQAEEILAAYAAAPPQGQTLILTAPARTASNPIVKNLNKKACFIECSKLTPRETEDWLKEEAKKAGCTFENAAIVKRLAGSGQDLYYLLQLVKKLALLAKNGKITVDLLENQVEYRQEIKIFRLIDMILERRTEPAIEALHQLLKQGEAEIYILYMINRQFTLYAQIKALSEEGASPAEIEKATGQKSFTVKKMLERARKYRWPEIENGLQLILQTDIDLKSSSRSATLALEVLIVNLTKGTGRAAFAEV